MTKQIKIIMIGGSWGSIQASLSILRKIPEGYKIPIVLILHRLRNSESGLESILDKRIKLEVCEISDKQKIKAGVVYLAPSNYHVLIENEESFSLDISEPENYSRPSIDVSFKSGAYVFGNRMAGIVLSGANKDGSEGLRMIAEKGGIAIVQDPEEAEIKVMPEAAIAAVPGCVIANLETIAKILIGFDEH
jgi:two-component system chemotaxis response regulator CheB